MGRTRPEQEADRLSRGGINRTTATAARSFIRTVRRVSQVRAIIVVPAGDTLGIWTLLDGDWGGEGRGAIYERELETLQRYPEAALDFRVVDEAEYRAYGREAPLPSGAHLVFTRPVTLGAALAGSPSPTPPAPPLG